MLRIGRGFNPDPKEREGVNIYGKDGVFVCRVTIENIYKGGVGLGFFAPRENAIVRCEIDPRDAENRRCEVGHDGDRHQGG